MLDPLGEPLLRPRLPVKVRVVPCAPALAVETRGLTVEFNGFAAVHGVDLRIERGALHGLIGPNGAGKTTCFNLLTKFIAPTAGTILINGEDVTRLRPFEIARRKVVRSFQISAIFPEMSVLRNVRIALQRPLTKDYHFWESSTALDDLGRQAMELLSRFGLDHWAHVRAGDLSYGRKRSLELATTLALEPDILLLDEPTAGMSHEEIPAVIELIRAAARGRTVVMVEHNLSVVSTLCSRITVLARGSVLSEGSYEDVARDPAVIEAYLGQWDD